MGAPQLTCTRCGFRGDVVTETQKIGGHLFVGLMLLIAAALAFASLCAAGTVYAATTDINDKRSEITAKLTDASTVPVRMPDGIVWTVPFAELDEAAEKGAKAVSPAEYRKALERSIKHDIDWDNEIRVGCALLALLGLCGTIAVLASVRRRQRYWQAYAFCAGCNAPLGRLRG